MSKKNIVIVGGGYAGINLIHQIEKTLPTTHRIILIEEQEFMYVKIGAARAAASEDISEKVLLPYDKLFKSEDVGIVVQASVTKINAHSVTLSKPHNLFGTEIDFDYLIIATGSDWKDPIALHTLSRKEAIDLLAKRRKEVASAKDIVIIGGGPVGIELSGEIKMVNPKAKVTIVHGANLPVSDAFPDYFRQKVVTTLKEHGIDMILNEFVDLNTINNGSKSVTLKSGKTLAADLVFVAAGATPRGEIIKTLSPNLYNPKTHSIKVKNTFQLDDPAYPHIFAAGDVADTVDLKMAYKAGLHAPIIAKNIKSLISGQEPKAIYKPSTGSEMMVIPMGKMGGVSYLSFFGGFTLGNWATKQMKGKNLFVDQQKKLLVRY